jgi:hypothetical protein
VTPLVGFEAEVSCSLRKLDLGFRDAIRACYERRHEVVQVVDELIPAMVRLEDPVQRFCEEI